MREMLRHLGGCRRLLLQAVGGHLSAANKLDRSSFALESLANFSTTNRTMASQKHAMTKRLAGTDNNVWVEFGRLAVENQALNLGQGFSDYFPPSYVTDALKQVAESSNPFMHQYTRSYGHPRLVKAIADTYSSVHGRKIDMNEEVLCTVGAYGSLFCAVQGLVNPGDEVIIIEPYFDCYEPMVTVAGGVPVFVALKPTKDADVISSSDWQLDPEELASKFNSKTKAIIVNNPNNPLGKIFTKAELEMIAGLCRKHDVIVIADEVYEWLVYKPNEHIRIATLPDMWDRTVTISSAGKTFSVTGWKLGWSIGPKHLIKALCTVHQNCNYTCPTIVQEAIALSFEKELPRMASPECYYNSLSEELRPKRDKMAKFLSEVGMRPTIPEGGYFMVADFSKLQVSIDEQSTESKDYQFVKWMCKNKKLASIPTSAFYTRPDKHLAENLVRFCFFKEDATLDKAADIMREWKKSLSGKL